MTGILTTALTGFFILSAATGTLTESVLKPVEEPARSKIEVRSGSRAVSDEAPKLPAISTHTVSMTGYNALPEQTDSDPFTTASGAYSNPEVIAAVSKDLRYGDLPFGTVIELSYDGKSNNCGFRAVEHLIGYRIVADQMNARFEKKIDILFDQEDKVMIAVNGQLAKPTNPARALGECRGVTARAVGKIDIKDIPQTQTELKAVLGKSAVAVNR
jgi:3D (Asp-Asp-Asp) domain-containing protein